MIDPRPSHLRRAATVDRLPPHSMEAEQGILGCCLLDPAQSLPQVEERFKGERVFYDLRHAEIFHAIAGLRREGVAVDLITVVQRLKDAGQLDAIGGIAYLSATIDAVPSAANLPSYLDIVWEKFLARQLVANSTEIVSQIYDHDGVTETLLERIKRLQAEFEQRSDRGKIQPRYLKPASEFGEAAFGHFFGSHEEQPGSDLPIRFPMRVRPGETTLLTGDDGAGKSTLLGYFGIHLAQAGVKLCVASMEMPPAVSLWIMASQLLGGKRLPDSETGRRRAAEAVAWLSSRVTFYDFLGIADWRDLLDSFRYAARKMGATLFILDSVMRIGIPDDDYAQQGIAAAHFAQFCKECGAHLFFVVHENKGSAAGKNRIRGSKLWTANADNVLRIEINAEKEQKASESRLKLREEKSQHAPDEEAVRKYDDQLARRTKEWDSHLVLQKQRYPGSRQNASHFMWFDHESFQFRDRWEDRPVDWLNQWMKA